MSELTFGVIGTSKKSDEHRVPIHPEHLARIPEDLRRRLIFEKGYGLPFDVEDSEIAAQTGGMASRSELLADLGRVILPKPVPSDLEELREGGILWGWPHCVQQFEITQTAVDRRQTLIAFEDMFGWSSRGERGRHTFYKNNELAGYCAALHALQLKGIDGHYGKQCNTTIFSFGAVSRGAIYALKARGFTNITICTLRPCHEVREEVLDCHYVQVRPGEKGEARMMVVEVDGAKRPLTELIAESDIIVNGILQNPNRPLDFVTEQEKDFLKPGCLIIDISCDEGMGFYFARPTSFEDPMFKVGKVYYYSVDHTPTYLWDSASRCISAALLIHLPTIMAGPASWEADETVKRCLNIVDGVIRMPSILAFQKREDEYPHTVKGSSSAG